MERAHWMLPEQHLFLKPPNRNSEIFAQVVGPQRRHKNKEKWAKFPLTIESLYKIIRVELYNVVIHINFIICLYKISFFVFFFLFFSSPPPEKITS